MNQNQYTNAVVELAVAGRPEPLKRILASRIRGEAEPITVRIGEAEEQVVSPPLERDEPDRNAILYTVYSILSQAENTGGIENLRRASAELLMAGFNQQEDHEYLSGLARLVGHLRVVDSDELRPILQQQLYGFLESQLERPLGKLIELEDAALERATLALDAWLAVTPIQPKYRPHHEKRIEALFDANLDVLETGNFRLEPRLRFLVLTFRALVKLKPSVAGARGLWRVSTLIHEYSAELPGIRRRWLADCRHLGVVLAANSDWRRSFFEGVLQFQYQAEFEERETVPLFRESLSRIDGMWPEIEAAWRKPPPTDRTALRVIAGGRIAHAG